MYPNKSFVCSNKCFIWKAFPSADAVKVPIFSGLNQGLEVAEGWGMFFKQNCINCKKNVNIICGRASLKNKRVVSGFQS